VSRTDALQTVLAGTDAAVYAYGVVAARLTGAERTRALSDMALHRAARDDLAAQVVGAGAVPTPAAAAYDLPAPVSDAASARRLAALVEDRLAGQWAGLAGQSDTAQRTAAATAAVACAVRQVGWSGLAPVWNGSA
jgi:hypothetical protein